MGQYPTGVRLCNRGHWYSGTEECESCQRQRRAVHERQTRRLARKGERTHRRLRLLPWRHA